MAFSRPAVTSHQGQVPAQHMSFRHQGITREHFQAGACRDMKVQHDGSLVCPSSSSSFIGPPGGAHVTTIPHSKKRNAAPRRYPYNPWYAPGKKTIEYSDNETSNIVLPSWERSKQLIQGLLLAHALPRIPQGGREACKNALRFVRSLGHCLHGKSDALELWTASNIAVAIHPECFVNSMLCWPTLEWRLPWITYTESGRYAPKQGQRWSLVSSCLAGTVLSFLVNSQKTKRRPDSHPIATMLVTKATSTEHEDAFHSARVAGSTMWFQPLWCLFWNACIGSWLVSTAVTR